MTQKRSTLETDIRVAFERACREGDYLVAEHLLQALESIAKREGNPQQLENAYLQFANGQSRR